MQLTERIGDAAVKAKKLGLSYYGNNEWGKAGVVTHIQSGVNILSATDHRPPTKKIQPIPLSKNVRSKINKTDWDFLGAGVQSSVYKSKTGPKNSVVKVSGAGNPQKGGVSGDQKTDLAFIHFLMDYGKHYPHLPVIHDLDTSDDHVLQIKMETLKSLPDELAHALEVLADDIDSIGRARWDTREDLQNAIDDIIATIKILKAKQKEYRDKYSEKKTRQNDGLDLHSKNWGIAVDGRIIAADPWYGG